MRRSTSGRAAVLRTPLGISTLVLLVAVVGVAVVAPLVLGSRAETIDVAAMDQGMSAQHLFGTDPLGRDLLARTLVATRLSVVLAVITTVVAAVVGVLAGALPFVLGRRLGRLLVATINLSVAFPSLLLALFLAMIFGVGAQGAVLTLALAMAPGFARLTHSTAAAVAGSDYIAAARLLRVGRARIVLRHILPNIAEPLVVNATTTVGTALLSLSGLSYLGFGVQAPDYDWGRLLSDGLGSIYTTPAAGLLPCAAIVVAGLTFILAGEVATQVVSGRSRRRGTARRVVTAPVAPVAEDTGPAGDVVLRVEDLTVTFPDRGTRPVRGVSFEVRAGEVVGVVGESGSGKSLTAAAVGALVPHPGVVEATRLDLAGRDVRRLGRAERDRVLGTSLATVFQDPMSALNPAVRVGLQLAEVSRVHQGLSRRAAAARAVDRLAAVDIPSPERRAREYPGTFSGGMRQRAMIGMSLMAEPSLIIADEPTTALDVTVQQGVLALLRDVVRQRNAALLFISHDIAVVSRIASRVLVMYAGQIIEELPVSALVDDAAHPYTRALVASIPDMGMDRRLPLATIDGRPPEPDRLPVGCSFAPRCPLADVGCAEQAPPLVAIGENRRVACWKPPSDVGGPRSTAGEGGRG
ncbi:dipeptide/oligopeptide/nickel ABC transporter permease/ATP-binding protein [Umezawaea endophytica]|uniref:Dipeptide/oligopeptide/nickel ABC transporter permease/ATP-binding protein n=1 Tax=Umezawaea endophytica TaxID=1654476 RepID=A0A9X2ZXU2_9PSEU|nr:dipeptide/oligopeptide/nickel ABC transporter permease/ATP-binding protein [Umezawaea endophytica]MCS7475724.1 dipeptide/oligopeptide/nickel ABC transporter permease/ATP-binding protein [Umezawaea endophytica]